ERGGVRGGSGARRQAPEGGPQPGRPRLPPLVEGASQSFAQRAGLAHAMRDHAWAPAIDSRCPRAARSAAVSRYEASSCDASGTPPHPGMLHISTTYGFPSLSMMSTL